MESSKKKLRCDNSTIEEHAIHDNQTSEILNDDCLLHVFEYLSISDRIRLERVNNRWCTVSRLSWQSFKTLSFTNDLWGRFKKGQVTKKTLRKVLSRCGRFITFWDMSESQVLTEKMDISYLLRYCPNLTSVDFTSITVGVPLINSLIENCKKIVRLNIGTTTRHVSGSFLQSTIVDTYSHLQVLELESSNLFGDWMEFKDSNSVSELYFENCQELTTTNLAPAITRLPNLRTLSLQGSLLCWKNPADLKFIKLSNIKELDISNNSVYITDDCLFQIAGVNLTSLYVGGNCCVSDVGLRAVVSSSKLEHLSIEGMHVDGSSLTDLPDLKTLWCSDCICLEEDHFQYLFETSEKLEFVDLRDVLIADDLIGIAESAVVTRSNDIALKILVNKVNVDISGIPNNLKLYDSCYTKMAVDRNNLILYSSNTLVLEGCVKRN